MALIFKKNNKKILLSFVSALFFFSIGQHCSASSGASGTVSVTQFLSGAAVVTGVGISVLGFYNKRSAIKYNAVTEALCKSPCGPDDKDPDTFLYNTNREKNVFNRSVVGFEKNGKFHRADSLSASTGNFCILSGRFEWGTVRTMEPINNEVIESHIKHPRSRLQGETGTDEDCYCGRVVTGFVYDCLKGALSVPAYRKEAQQFLLDADSKNSFSTTILYVTRSIVWPSVERPNCNLNRQRFINLRKHARANRDEGLPGECIKGADMQMKCGLTMLACGLSGLALSSFGSNG